jgi:hypothetical protein
LITWRDDSTDDLKKRTTTTQVLPSDAIITWEDKGSIDDTKKRDGGINLPNLLSKRSSDYISSCGPRSGWIPLEYFGTELTSHMGWDAAVMCSVAIWMGSICLLVNLRQLMYATKTTGQTAAHKWLSKMRYSVTLNVSSNPSLNMAQV